MQVCGNPPSRDCSGGYAYGFNARIQSGALPLLQVGQAVLAQNWYRDPAGGFGSRLSDVGRFTLQP